MSGVDMSKWCATCQRERPEIPCEDCGQMCERCGMLKGVHVRVTDHGVMGLGFGGTEAIICPTSLFRRSKVLEQARG